MDATITREDCCNGVALSGTSPSQPHQDEAPQSGEVSETKNARHPASLDARTPLSCASEGDSLSSTEEPVFHILAALTGTKLLQLQSKFITSGSQLKHLIERNCCIPWEAQHISLSDGQMLMDGPLPPHLRTRTTDMLLTQTSISKAERRRIMQEQRHYVIMCALLRTLKACGQMRLEELIWEAQRLVSYHCRASADVVEKVIDDLVGREYMARGSDDGCTVRYIA